MRDVWCVLNRALTLVPSTFTNLTLLANGYVNVRPWHGQKVAHITYLRSSIFKIFAITVKGFEPVTSYVRDKDATTVPARYMWETIFKFTSIHASIIYHIPWIHWNHWISILFRENSIGCTQVDVQHWFLILKILFTLISMKLKNLLT